MRKSPLIKFWKVVLDTSRANKHLHRIGCGGNDWTAKHWFWRLYLVR